MKPHFLSVRQVAERLGRSDRWVRRALKDGTIKGRQDPVKGTYFVSAESVEAFEARLVPVAKEAPEPAPEPAPAAEPVEAPETPPDEPEPLPAAEDPAPADEAPEEPPAPAPGDRKDMWEDW